MTNSEPARHDLRPAFAAAYRERWGLDEEPAQVRPEPEQLAERIQLEAAPRGLQLVARKAATVELVTRARGPWPCREGWRTATTYGLRARGPDGAVVVCLWVEKPSDPEAFAFDFAIVDGAGVVKSGEAKLVLASGLEALRASRLEADT